MCSICAKVDRKEKLIQHFKTHHGGEVKPLEKFKYPSDPIYINWKEMINSNEWVEPILDPKKKLKF